MKPIIQYLYIFYHISVLNTGFCCWVPVFLKETRKNGVPPLFCRNKLILVPPHIDEESCCRWYFPPKMSCCHGFYYWKFQLNLTFEKRKMKEQTWSDFVHQCSIRYHHHRLFANQRLELSNYNRGHIRGSMSNSLIPCVKRNQTHLCTP